MATPLQTAQGPTSPRIERVAWKHDEMIDFILERAGSFKKVTQNEIAEHFGYSPMWVSCIINSDAFQARLAERKSELIDPLLRGDIEEAIQGLVTRSVEILREELDRKPSFDNAMEIFKAAGKNLGLGRKAPVTVNVNGENSLVSVLSGLGPQARVEPQAGEKLVGSGSAAQE